MVIVVELLGFESFVELMAHFKSTQKNDKLTRLFKIIDDDNNCKISYQEVWTLVYRSLATYSRLWEDVGQDYGKELNDDMSTYCSRYIFQMCGVSEDEEISFNQMGDLLSNDKNGRELLEMFCGEGAVDVI